MWLFHKFCYFKLIFHKGKLWKSLSCSNLSILQTVRFWMALAPFSYHMQQVLKPSYCPSEQLCPISQGCKLLSHCDLKIVILPQFFLWIFKLVRSSSLMAVGSCPFSLCFLASPMSWSRECRTDASRLAYSAVLGIKLQRATGECCWRHHVLAANVWPFCTQ